MTSEAVLLTFLAERPLIAGFGRLYVSMWLELCTVWASVAWFWLLTFCSRIVTVNVVVRVLSIDLLVSLCVTRVVFVLLSLCLDWMVVTIGWGLGPRLGVVGLVGGRATFCFVRVLF